MQPEVKAFFDSVTNTISYVVWDKETLNSAIIDSVLNLDYSAGRIDYKSADEIISFIRSKKLILDWIIETHVHADHLSAAPYIQNKLGGKLMIGKNIIDVQNTFGKIFNEGTEFERDGSQFDVLLSDGDAYKIGNIEAYAIDTPGHTPACMTHVIGDSAFVGDTLFMPDGGSARADFPGGDASELYDSINKVLSLPDETRLFICHDYGPNGRPIKWETTVKEERENNIHVGRDKTKKDFIKMRTERDASLKMPNLIIPSLQVNMRGGEIPQDSDGNLVLKTPINKL